MTVTLYMAMVAIGILGGGVCMTLAAGVGSSYRVHVMLFIVASFAFTLGISIRFVHRMCEEIPRNDTVAMFFFVVWGIPKVLFQALIRKSVKALEETLGENLRSSVIRPLYRFQAALTLAMLIVYLLEVANIELIAQPIAAAMAFVSMGIVLLIDLATSVLAARAYRKQYTLASQTKKALETENLASDLSLATHAECLTRRHCWVMFQMTLVVILGLLSLVSLVLVDERDILEFVWALLYDLDSLARCIGALILCGVVDRHSFASKAQVDAEEMRERRQTAVATRFNSLRGGHREWWAKVEELSQRGVTLEALLHFYRGLGVDYMTNFNPDVHTTKDVVRAAIIPLSAERACAMAQVMMGGEKVLPKNMVTHNWSNLFKFLVAGIVADALGSADFGIVADFLSWDIDLLLGMLGRKGKLQETYWICAFSISQHDSICGSNPYSDVDPVSRAVHKTCPCNKRKYFNTDGTLDPEGRSVECELNKFDDVMALLAASNPYFSQIICVDGSFDLFTRAWCIAEIAEAFYLGMRQRVQVLSRKRAEKHEPMLRALRVEDMQASRREDVEQILAKIPDKAKFNSKLQEMLFGHTGLLNLWAQLDGKQRLTSIGWWLRWARELQGRRSCLIEADLETVQSSVSDPSPDRPSPVSV